MTYKAASTTEFDVRTSDEALPRFTSAASEAVGGDYQPLDLDRVLPQKEQYHVEGEPAVFEAPAADGPEVFGTTYDLLQTEECEVDEEFGALVTALDDTERELFHVDADAVLERFTALQEDLPATDEQPVHPGLETLTLEQRYGLGAFLVTLIAEKERELRHDDGLVISTLSSVVTSADAPQCDVDGDQAPAAATQEHRTATSPSKRILERDLPTSNAIEVDRPGAGDRPPVSIEGHSPAPEPHERPSTASTERQSASSRRPALRNLPAYDTSFAERYVQLLLSGLGLTCSQREALMYLWRACLEGELIPAQRCALVASTAALVGAPAVRFAALQAMLTLSLAPGGYDARCRVFLRDAARELQIPWRKMALVEYAIAALLQQQQQQQQRIRGVTLDAASILSPSTLGQPEESRAPTCPELNGGNVDPQIYATLAKKRYKRKSRRRAFKIAAMAIGGGALFGLAGALAAPLLLPALVGIGITGASALAATGTVASGAVVGSFFGGLGAGYVGHKARKRTRMRLTEFELEPLGIEEAARSWHQQHTKAAKTTALSGEAAAPPSTPRYDIAVGAAHVSSPVQGESASHGPGWTEAEQQLAAAIRESLQVSEQRALPHQHLRALDNGERVRLTAGMYTGSGSSSPCRPTPVSFDAANGVETLQLTALDDDADDKSSEHWGESTMESAAQRGARYPAADTSEQVESLETSRSSPSSLSRANSSSPRESAVQQQRAHLHHSIQQSTTELGARMSGAIEATRDAPAEKLDVKRSATVQVPESAMEETIDTVDDASVPVPDPVTFQERQQTQRQHIDDSDLPRDTLFADKSHRLRLPEEPSPQQPQLPFASVRTLKSSSHPSGLAPAPMLPEPPTRGTAPLVAASNEDTTGFSGESVGALSTTSLRTASGQGFRHATPASILEKRLAERTWTLRPLHPTTEAHRDDAAATEKASGTSAASDGGAGGAGNQGLTRATATDAATADDIDSAAVPPSTHETQSGTEDNGAAELVKQEHPLMATRMVRSRGLHLVIFVPGWLTRSRQEGACASQFYSALGNGRLLPYAERYALRWEPDQLFEMGRAFLKFWTTKAATTAAQQAAPHVLQAVSFAAGTLLSSIAWPLFVYSAADIVDGPWSVLLNRANAAGDALADLLALREQGQRPVTLIGYSHGARVVFKCLEALADAGVYGVVDDAFLVGAPCTGDSRRWQRASRAVSGRLVNAYCGTDWALALFHRGSSGQFRVAGLSPIRGCGERVENVNLALLGLEGHRSLREALPRILTALGVETGGLSFPPILPRDVALLGETDAPSLKRPPRGVSTSATTAGTSDAATIDEVSSGNAEARRKGALFDRHRHSRRRDEMRFGTDQRGRLSKRELYEQDEDDRQLSLDEDAHLHLLRSSTEGSVPASVAKQYSGKAAVSRTYGSMVQQSALPLIDIETSSDLSSEERGSGSAPQTRPLLPSTRGTWGGSASAFPSRAGSSDSLSGYHDRESGCEEAGRTLSGVFAPGTTAAGAAVAVAGGGGGDVAHAASENTSPAVQSSVDAASASTCSADWTEFVGVAPNQTEDQPKALVHALGIEVAGGRFLPLIEAGTCFPCERTVTVTTCVDRQDAIAFFIYQGSRLRLRPLGAKDAHRHHRLLKIVEFHGFKSPVRHRAGGARVELAFTLDEHGNLEVSIRDVRGDAEETRCTIPSTMLVQRRDAFDSDTESNAADEVSFAELDDTLPGDHSEMRFQREAASLSTLRPSERTAEYTAHAAEASATAPGTQWQTQGSSAEKAKRSKWWSWRRSRRHRLHDHPCQPSASRPRAQDGYTTTTWHSGA